MKGGGSMLGLPDFWIWSAYLFCILSAVLCVVYGLVNWNRGADEEEQQVQEENRWEEAEKEIEANL